MTLDESINDVYQERAEADRASGMAGFRESDTTKSLDFPNCFISGLLVVLVDLCFCFLFCLFVPAADATVAHLHCLEC